MRFESNIHKWHLPPKNAPILAKSKRNVYMIMIFIMFTHEGKEECYIIYYNTLNLSQNKP